MRWWSEGGRTERALEAVLRVGAAGCFIGHGAFGIMGKEAWLPYFAVAGIPESWAWTLMPLVGGVDILVGILVLFSPRPAVLGYMVVWGLWTALLRPLAGESVFETLERAGNYGIPLAFMVAAGVRLRGFRLRDWFAEAGVLRLTPERKRRVELVLRGTLGLLLVGHGGLAALTAKPLLIEHLAVVGLPAGALPIMGWAEIALGLAVAARPAPALLVTALLWKLGTEALYPVAGAPVWEFVERAGSYAAPLALLVLSPAFSRLRVEPARARVLARKGGLAFLVLLAVATLAAAFVTSARAQPARPAPTTSLRSAVPAASPETLPDTTLLGMLRDGGLVLACRHAITDRSRGDSRRVDYDDPSTQRVLSADGRAQARRLGEVLGELGVPVGEVLAGPYHRNRESAELAFGAATITDALVYGNRGEQVRERRRLLRERPDGGNRVLMTHQGILYGMLPSVERGSIREGDCVLVQPLGDDHRALARLGPEDFATELLHTSLTLSASSTGRVRRMLKDARD